MKSFFLPSLLLIFLTASFAHAAVEIYPPLPDHLYESAKYEVSVTWDGQTRDSCVLTTVNDTKPDRIPYMTTANHWTTFSMDEGTEVKVTVRCKDQKLESAVIRPLSRKIPFEIKDGVLTFTLTKPQNLFIDLAGCEREPLFVFANPIEPNAPTAETDDTHYFGPGVHSIGEFTITKPRVYLAPGAYVKGNLRFSKDLKDTVEIFGPGILSGIDYTHDPEGWDNHILIKGGEWLKQVIMRDFTLVDSPGCNIAVRTKLDAGNLKFFAWTSCSDGISGGRDSLIHDCFFKTMDDNIHITMSGTQVRNTVHYLQAHGSALVMGWCQAHDAQDVHVDGVEIVGDSRIAFRPKTWPIREKHYNAAVVALNNMKGTKEGEGVHYHDMIVENVTVEVGMLTPVSIQVKAEFTMLGLNGETLHYDEGLGHVSNLTFRNFNILVKPGSRPVFDGNGQKDGSIRGVTFENWTVEGEKMTQETMDQFIIRQGKTYDFRVIE